MPHEHHEGANPFAELVKDELSAILQFGMPVGSCAHWTIESPEEVVFEQKESVLGQLLESGTNGPLLTKGMAAYAAALRLREAMWRRTTASGVPALVVDGSWKDGCGYASVAFSFGGSAEKDESEDEALIGWNPRPAVFSRHCGLVGAESSLDAERAAVALGVETALAILAGDAETWGGLPMREDGSPFMVFSDCKEIVEKAAAKEIRWRKRRTGFLGMASDDVAGMGREYGWIGAEAAAFRWTVRSASPSMPGLKDTGFVQHIMDALCTVQGANRNQETPR